MLLAYKYRIYPTGNQSELINKHIGACRFIYNLALETKNYAYASQRKKLSCFDLISQIPDLKKECEWLKEIDSQALQQSVIDLDKAFTQFFKGYADFPNFKKRRGNQKFRNPHGDKVQIKSGKLYQPKFLDGIKIIIDRKHKGKIKNTTISRATTGKYFVSVLCETKAKLPKKKPIKESTAIGVDLGIKSFIVASDGLKIDNPKFLKQSIERVKVLQRRMRNKKKCSKNQKKAYHQIAVIHEKIANQRKDFLHKLSSKLISENQTICFEDLNISGMVKNHKLAQAISDSGWGKFVEFCKYKAEWKGKNILQIPTFEPSTKLCSKCGAKNHTLTLKDREWICAGCGTLHDRDINAAVNIKNYCLTNSGRGTPGVSVEMSALVESMKQKVSK